MFIFKPTFPDNLVTFKTGSTNLLKRDTPKQNFDEEEAEEEKEEEKEVLEHI